MNLAMIRQNIATKSFKKTATGTANTTCTFMRTSKGDGQMPWHITVCLMTCADGKFLVDCCVLGGRLDSIVDNII